MRPINSGPAKIVTIGLEFCSKMFQGFLQAPEEGNKIFQKFLETWLFKKLESIYLSTT